MEENKIYFVDEYKIEQLLKDFDLLVPDRHREKVWQRCAVVAFLRKNNFGWMQISRMLKRTHASCIHMNEVYETEINHPDFQTKIRPITLKLAQCMVEAEKQPDALSYNYIRAELNNLRRTVETLQQYIDERVV